MLFLISVFILLEGCRTHLFRTSNYLFISNGLAMVSLRTQLRTSLWLFARKKDAAEISRLLFVVGFKVSNSFSFYLLTSNEL